MVNLTSGVHEARSLYCVADGQVILNNYENSPTIDVFAGEVFAFIGTTITIVSGKYHLA